MTEPKLCNTLDEYRQEIEAHSGFVIKEQLEHLLAKWHDRVRLHQCLVRCGSGRFTCPMQDVEHFLEIIKNEGSDYVRDVQVTMPGRLGDPTL